MRRLLIGILFFLLLAFPAFAAYPGYSGYVNDFAHVLSDQFVQQLENKLAAFDKKTTDQIAVVTVDTVQPETIEEYTIHLADKWKPGQKGKDNGIIMLFAMQDRQMRIEVGRGLEGDLTDLQSKHILDTVIRPEFRAGNYERGIDKGVNAVLTAIDPSFTATASASSIAPTQDNAIGDIIFFIIFFIIVFFFIAFSPFTPLGGYGVWGIPTVWGSGKNSSDGFGGFGGGGFSGGGGSSKW